MTTEFQITLIHRDMKTQYSIGYDTRNITKLCNIQISQTIPIYSVSLTENLLASHFILYIILKEKKNLNFY